MNVLLLPAALSPKSKKNDAGCLRSWERFCVERSLPVLPTTLEALRVYLTDMPARVTAGTLRHVVGSVRRWHLESGLGDPADEAFFEELRRAQRRCRVPELIPCLTHDLALVVDRMPNTPAGMRDKLLLLLIYAVRISAPAAAKLNRSDVRIEPRGMVLNVRYGRRTKEMTLRRHHDARYCPVSAMEHYLELFRDDDEAALIRVCHIGRLTQKRLSLRRTATAMRFRFRAAGLALPAMISLRAGMLVVATNRGADEYAIMRQQGYSRETTVRNLQSRLRLNEVDAVDKLRL